MGLRFSDGSPISPPTAEEHLTRLQVRATILVQKKLRELPQILTQHMLLQPAPPSVLAHTNPRAPMARVHCICVS